MPLPHVPPLHQGRDVMRRQDGDAEGIQLDSDVVWHPARPRLDQPVRHGAAHVGRGAEDGAGAAHEADAVVGNIAGKRLINA
jgi:hypothetical protein